MTLISVLMVMGVAKQASACCSRDVVVILSCIQTHSRRKDKKTTEKWEKIFEAKCFGRLSDNSVECLDAKVERNCLRFFGQKNFFKQIQ